MKSQTAIGSILLGSNPIICAASSAVGIAKTGTSIGSLSGAAYTSATAAWIGLGSMNVGLFMMNIFPIVGGLLVLDSLCGPESSTPLIDWYEEAWIRYEAQCEMEAMKKTVVVDPDHRIVLKRRPSSLAQQESLYRDLEIEHELYLMKKKLGLL